MAGGDEPSKPSGGDVSPPKQHFGRDEQREPSTADNYVAGRIANRAGAVAGMRSVGMVSAILSTIGLSLLRKRGKAGVGAALVATAAGLSLLKRRN